MRVSSISFRHDSLNAKSCDYNKVCDSPTRSFHQPMVKIPLNTFRTLLAAALIAIPSISGNDNNNEISSNKLDHIENPIVSGNIHNIRIKPKGKIDSWLNPNKVTISFLNSEGTTSTYNFYSAGSYCKASVVSNLFEDIKHYSGDKTPEITPEEVFKMNEKFYGNSMEHHVNKKRDAFTLEGYRTLIEHYMQEGSDGGKNITVEEQKLLMENLGKLMGVKPIPGFFN